MFRCSIIAVDINAKKISGQPNRNLNFDVSKLHFYCQYVTDVQASESSYNTDDFELDFADDYRCHTAKLRVATLVADKAEVTVVMYEK